MKNASALEWWLVGVECNVPLWARGHALEHFGRSQWNARTMWLL